DERWLVVSPPESLAVFSELAQPHWQVVPQADGDLGERMRRFFEAAFIAGAQRVVLIGSDSPTLPRERLDEAFRKLSTCDVVLGPSDDGGYYLIGCARPIDAIFKDISWSTPQVFEQT